VKDVIYKCPLEQQNDVIMVLTRQIKSLEAEIETLNILVESQQRRIAIQEQKLEDYDG